MNRLLKGALGTLGVEMAGYLAVGEASHAWAHRQGLGHPPAVAGRREVILLLGYPSKPDGSPHPLQRWRARIAARSTSPQAASSQIICTGAAVREEVWRESARRFASGGSTRRSSVQG